jgi:hypothetical protein
MKKSGPVHRADFHAEFGNARLVLPLCEAAITDNSLADKAFRPLALFGKNRLSWSCAPFIASLKQRVDAGWRREHTDPALC